MIVQTHARGIPIALVNGRITAQSFARKRRAKGVFRDILTRMSLITAQDPDTAKRLTQLGARAAKVSGSLKPAAPALAVDAARLAQMQRLIGSRRVWVAASSHAGDEAEAIAAQASLTDWLLILVPRDVARAAEVAAKLAQAAGLRYAQQSTGGMPSADDQVYLADSYGELGLWYHLAQVAFVGGGFDNIGGHNPWEPAILGAAVVHGPDVHNFAADYTLLHGTAAAIRVDAGQLATTIATLDAAALTTQATRLVAEAHLSLDGLAADLLALIGVPT
jgi:3-deoxy-D-manno-octulosonic-acid transferase